LLLFSLSVFAMYFVDYFRGKPYEFLYLVVNGSVFWGSFLLLIIACFVVSLLRRKDKAFQKDNPKHLPGCICFFKNLPAKIADIILLISLIATGILFVLDVRLMIRGELQMLVFISITLFIFSFGMHSILNGINYKYFTRCKGEKKND